mmetsp:Transcript_136792/g.237590  ORF Transcript_136792/g.237590 Transcript_136792/m.237590 type:complete len:204 (-) Transcript_136792:4431-5042(-)
MICFRLRATRGSSSSFDCRGLSLSLSNKRTRQPIILCRVNGSGMMLHRSKCGRLQQRCIQSRYGRPRWTVRFCSSRETTRYASSQVNAVPANGGHAAWAPPCGKYRVRKSCSEGGFTIQLNCSMSSTSRRWFSCQVNTATNFSRSPGPMAPRRSLYVYVRMLSLPKARDRSANTSSTGPTSILASSGGSIWSPSSCSRSSVDW